MTMEIRPVAFFRSPFPEKFGIPRQAGVVPSLEGRVELTAPYDDPSALRGLEGFEYAWLIWGFSANAAPEEDGASFRATVRPPRLGGNERVGVFASRSPFRPNGLGLSAVRIRQVGPGPVILVEGADLMDGTPVYDIKPYVPYADSHPGVRSGFVDAAQWEPLRVVIPDAVRETALRDGMEERTLDTLEEVLAQDPRPAFQDDPARAYGLTFDGFQIRFTVEGKQLTVKEIRKNSP